jgi:hypothetical protein
LGPDCDGVKKIRDGVGQNVEKGLMRTRFFDEIFVCNPRFFDEIDICNAAVWLP